MTSPKLNSTITNATDNEVDEISLYPLLSHIILCDFTDALSFFSFPYFPEFHRVDPLLQTCSTSTNP
jgi:hypothetical protein